MLVTVTGYVLVIVSFVLIGSSVYWFRRAAQLRSWPRADGTITQSSVRHVGTTGGTTGDAPLAHWFVPTVDYTYTFRGRQYFGDQITIDGLAHMFQGQAESILRPYQVGMKVRVYVDPKDPAYAVLLTRIDTTAASGYAVVGILLLGIVVYARYF